MTSTEPDIYREQHSKSQRCSGNHSRLPSDSIPADWGHMLKASDSQLPRRRHMPCKLGQFAPCCFTRIASIRFSSHHTSHARTFLTISPIRNTNFKDAARGIAGGQIRLLGHMVAKVSLLHRSFVFGPQLRPHIRSGAFSPRRGVLQLLHLIQANCQHQ